MFCRDITSSDAFTEMSLSAQALYFHLGLAADVSGFVTPKGTMRLINANTDDLRTLIAKQFVIPFESGVVVITHWNINNNIRETREAKSIYQKELKQLKEGSEGEYQLQDNSRSTPAQMSRDEMRREKSVATTVALPEKNLDSGITAPSAPDWHKQTKELFDYFISEFGANISKEPPTFTWGRCEKTVKPHLKKFGIERMKRMVTAYFGSNDKFYKQSSWSMQVFLMDSVIHSLSVKTQ